MLRVSPLILLVFGCGAATQTQSTTPVQEIEEIRIEARATDDGYEFDTYDAESLFDEGVRRSREGDCTAAMPLYERVVERFPDSRYVSPSLYNAALCLKEQGEPAQAAALFEKILRELPGSTDVEHATFQLLELYLELERFEDGFTAANRLLTQDDLTPDERVEAMARESQLHLASGARQAASARARETLSYARRRPDDDRVLQTYFLAAANFVQAETLRLQAEEVPIPIGGVDVQRPALERRAQLMLAAQREYFDTMRHTHPHWAAASGYQIGAMYDGFWDSIMGAPAPDPDPPLATPEENQIFVEEYRLSLARLVKPLIRHSIRYWELTLMMIERTGVETEWTERIREDLERARERLLEQPDGGAETPEDPPPIVEPPTGDPALRYPTGEGSIQAP